MMPHVVVSTPHEFCENHAAVLDHACDTVSEYAARGLVDLLRDGGLHVTQVRGTTNRRRLDLNRQVAHNHPFQVSIARSLRPGDMLLDVHSYPGAYPDPVMQDWGRYDLVLPAYPGLNEDDSEALAAALRSRGIRCKCVYPSQVDALNLYYVIQRFARVTRPAIMLEFNEDVGLSRLNTVLDVLADLLTPQQAVNAPRQAVAGRRFRRVSGYE